MNSRKDRAKEKTQKATKCIKEYKVTDKFYNMITIALIETKRVLEIRSKELEIWNPKHKSAFEKTFGLPGETPIKINFYTPGQKVNGNEEITPTQSGTTAHEFIKNGVNRMLTICNSLIIGKRMDENGEGIIYGNFSNLTDKPLGAARIPERQTLHIDLKKEIYKNKSLNEVLQLEYQRSINIDILQNFTCLKCTGEYSQVSTLCHELSHLYTIWDGRQYYGGLSSRDLGKGKELAHAKKLKDSLNPDVFKNAYNLEKYFEIN